MLLITRSTQRYHRSRTLLQMRFSKPGQATAQCPRLSDPLVSVSGRGELSQRSRSSATSQYWACVGFFFFFPAVCRRAKKGNKKDLSTVVPCSHLCPHWAHRGRKNQQDRSKWSDVTVSFHLKKRKKQKKKKNQESNQANGENCCYYYYYNN